VEEQLTTIIIAIINFISWIRHIVGSDMVRLNKSNQIHAKMDSKWLILFLEWNYSIF
jgi:hypothetical protein